MLSLHWPGHRFDPWPGNFHMLWVWPKKKKREEKNFKDEEITNSWDASDTSNK